MKVFIGHNFGPYAYDGNLNLYTPNGLTTTTVSYKNFKNFCFNSILYIKR